MIVVAIIRHDKKPRFLLITSDQLQFSCSGGGGRQQKSKLYQPSMPSKHLGLLTENPM